MLALILLLAAFFVLTPSPVFGAGSVIIATDTSLEVGQSFTVTVKYTAESIGRIKGELRYDPDMLEYISGGSSGQSAGIVQLSTGLSGETSYAYYVRFKVVGPGKNFFLVNTFEFVNGDEEDLGNPGASVAIQATQPEDEPAAQEPDPARPEDPGAGQPEAEDPDDTPDDETPGTQNPPGKQQAPGTHWVYAGALALTSLLLLAAILIVRHGRRK